MSWANRFGRYLELLDVDELASACMGIRDVQREQAHKTMWRVACKQWSAIGRIGVRKILVDVQEI